MTSTWWCSSRGPGWSASELELVRSEVLGISRENSEELLEELLGVQKKELTY